MSTSLHRILITGATGFVGQALCQQLLGKGFDVQILLRDPEQFNRIPLQLGASYVLGSLEDELSLEAACSNRDTVIHLAGLAHVGKKQGKQAMEINFHGSSKLLDAAINCGVKRFVFLSSTLADAAEKGQGDVTAYGESKLQFERLLQSAATQEKIESVILRAVNVYGKGMKGNIAAMISMIDRGRLPPLPKTNNQISLISVNDLAYWIVLAMEQSVATGQLYTLTDGQNYSISKLENAIYQALGRPIPGWRTPHMVLYGASLVAGLLFSMGLGNGSISGRTYRNLTSENLHSNEKAVAELGFKPAETFYRQLPEIIDAMHQQK